MVNPRFSLTKREKKDIMVGLSYGREVLTMKEANKSLLVGRAAAWLLSRIRENAVPLAASLIAGFLAYTFSFTNKLLNHDEAYSCS